MAQHTVLLRGYDADNRPIYASEYMWQWWLRVIDALGFTPTIVQGAWMSLAGGGASASAGYHDGGGCFDLRIWDLDIHQIGELIRTLRRMGAAAWVRDEQHGGMDPHIHFVLGSDFNIDDGAFWQWQRYLAGRDGLSTDGPDYHWRPDPIVTKPPEEEDELTPEDKTWIQKRFDASKRRDIAQTKVIKAQGDLLMAVLEKVPARITHSKQELLTAINELVEVDKESA